MKRDSQKDILKILDALGIESKANEAMHSTQAGYGDEFVPEDLAQTVIEKARDKSVILNRIPAENIWDPMPTQPYDIPVEGGDPTFYGSDESTDDNATTDAVSSSKAGTNKLQLDAKKYTAITYLSGELDEDARIAGGMQNYVTSKLGKAFAELIDKVWVNGDTTNAATGNVNLDDADPADNLYYLKQSGLVRAALDLSTDFSVGTMDTADFKVARKKLGLLGADPAELLWLFNLDTYYELLTIAQLETLEKRGPTATVIDGTVNSVQGIPVTYLSTFLKAEADGKISTTGSNNTLGRFLLIHLPSLYFGWRRKLKIVIDYLPHKDKYRICAHSRFAVKVNTNNSQTPVALGRNVTLS
jgi:HK97 family phage major capsid protein